MARHREFDEARVLDAATDCFWRDGYEATSVRSLAAHMGIAGASLYNAFGDKRSLFREVLHRYAERSMRERIRRLETALPPKEAVRAFVGEIIEHSVEGDRRGCLLVNTALDTAPHDQELGAEVAERLGELEAFFRRAIAAAQHVGSVPPERDAAELARLLLGVTLGLRVLARANPQRQLLEGLAQAALALLDWPKRHAAPGGNTSLIAVSRRARAPTNRRARRKSR